MAVHKLIKYAKDHQLCEKVDMREIASDFRSRNDGDPVIAVGGTECAWYLYGKMDSLYGGQYKEFRERCEWFVEQFRDMGFSLVFYFYGVPVEEKAVSWLKGRGVKAKAISQFFTKLRTEESGDIGNPSLLPSAIVPCAAVTFKQLGCTVRLSTTDRDTEMAQFAASNKSCVGVLSNNPDFMIYEGVPCLFTFKDLAVDENAFSDLTIAEKVTALRFRSVRIASHLGIEVRALPTLTSFVGNLIVTYDTLQVSHKKLSRKYGPQAIPKLIAELLKECGGNLEKMCKATYGNRWRESLELIQKSVHHYRWEADAPPPDPNISEWDAVLGLVKARHVSGEIPAYLYTVMKHRVTRCGAALEDLSVRSPDSPPVGLVVRGMLARMYVVLLWDSGPGPFLVEQDVQTGLEEVLRERVEVQKTMPDGLDHPGLLKLWTEVDDDRRWRIFVWVTSLAADPSVLRALSPQSLAVPAATLSYLYGGAKMSLEEVKIFVTVAVSVRHFSSRRLAGLRVQIPSERAVYLATLFVHTALCVLDAAAACGLSFPRPAECHLDSYFDGKLFHHIYCESRRTCNLKALTDWDKSCEETFNCLIDIIVKQNGMAN